MAINKSHPKYPEYAKKCKKLVERGREETARVQCSRGLDGSLGSIHRKYVNQLKVLQNEYADLFTEEE